MTIAGTEWSPHRKSKYTRFVCVLEARTGRITGVNSRTEGENKWRDDWNRKVFMGDVKAWYSRNIL